MEQEDTGVLKELAIGIRRLLSERLVSPLMPAFTVSWLVVNYRLVMVILSDESLESKLSFIDTILYPTTQCLVVHGFLLPLATALAYIFVYPYPAKWVYQYALKRQRELREARQQAENARVLTQEDSQRLRTYYFDRESALQKQIQAREEEIEQLRAKITELEEPQPHVEEAHATKQELSRELASINLTDDKAKVLGALSFAEGKGRNSLLETELNELVKLDMTDLKIILEELQRESLIERSYTVEGTNYSLKHEGRKAYKGYISQRDSAVLKTL